ncbi:MAG: hypothetical protein AAGA70_08460 [Pseudomonadota bacterium]
MRLFISILVIALGVSGCVPTASTRTVFPENVQSTQCFTGAYAFSFFVDVPDNFGQVLALTQHERTGSTLRSICRLVDGDGAGAYDAFTGEVSDGRSGMCISARTQAAGHVISCASPAEVRRAISATSGSSANTIDFATWSAYPG